MSVANIRELNNNNKKKESFTLTKLALNVFKFDFV